MPGQRPPLRLIEGTRPDTIPAPRLRPPVELAALGTGLVFVSVLLSHVRSWRASLGTFEALVAVAFAFFAMAVRFALRDRERETPQTAWIVLIVAVAARLALFPVTPTLSDDVWRYVWEGKVAALGGDPYRHAPADPALAPLRDRVVHPRINHPELATIYPPFAIAGFALVARLAPTLWAMKAWITLHDLALVVLLLAWTRRRSGSVGAVIAYAWNPLVLVEYAGGAHHDPTGLVWLVAALALAERRPLLSAAALAIAVGVKLAPLVALPLLLRRWPWRARALALGLLAALVAGYLMLTHGRDSGLAAYWRSWRNNELAFHYLASVLGGGERARDFVLVALAALAVGLGARRADPASGTRTLLRAGLILGPVVHPWYLGWTLALEPLGPSAPWLLLSATAMLSYGVLAPPPEGGAFHLSLAWRWVEYGAPLALAIALAGARARRGPART